MMSLSRLSSPSTLNNVTEMFSIVLCKYGRLHHKELQKLALTICDEALHMFSKYSWSQAISFFRRHSFFFIVNNDYVCAAKCDDPYSASLSGGEGSIAAFVYIFLRKFSSMPYLSFMNFFTSFCYASKQAISKLNACFFKNNENFKFYDDGTLECVLTYRSSTDFVEKNMGVEDEEKACAFFQMTLRVSGGMNYDDLIYNLNTALPEIGSFYFGLSSIEKFCYFKNRPKIFYIGSNGYVMLAEQALKAVIKFFRSLLQGNKEIYYLNLVKALRNSNLHVCEYFDINMFSEVIGFFYSNPRAFHVESDFYISAVIISPDICAEEKPTHGLRMCKSPELSDGEKEKKPQTLSVQSGGNKWEYCDKTVPSEEQVIMFLLSHLGKQNMHYRKLLSNCFRKSPYLLKFFEGCSSSQEFHFFKKHSNYFHFGSNGYVSAVHSKNSFKAQNKESKPQFSDVACNKSDVDYHFDFFKDTSELQKKMKENFFRIRLIDRLIEILAKNNQRKSTLSRLMNTAKSSGEYYAFFLCNMSLKDFGDMLRTRPDIFTFGDKGIVSLTDQFQEEPEKIEQTSLKSCLLTTEMNPTSCHQSYCDSESSCITTWEDLDISEECDSTQQKNTDFESETLYKNEQSSVVIKSSTDKCAEDEDYVAINNSKSVETNLKTQYQPAFERTISNSTVSDHENDTIVINCCQSFTVSENLHKTTCEDLDISEGHDLIQKNTHFESDAQYRNDKNSAVISLSKDTFAEDETHVTINNSLEASPKTRHQHAFETNISNSSLPDHQNEITVSQCYQSFTDSKKLGETTWKDLSVSEEQDCVCDKYNSLDNNAQYENHETVAKLKSTTGSCDEDEGDIASNSKSVKMNPLIQGHPIPEPNPSVPDQADEEYYSSVESCGFEIQELSEPTIVEQPDVSICACSSFEDTEKQDDGSETALKHKNMIDFKNASIDNLQVPLKSKSAQNPDLIKDRSSGSQNICQDQYIKCLINTINLAYEETKSAKKVLQSFLDLNKVSQKSSDSERFLDELLCNNEFNILQSQSRVEQKCVEFFRRVLHNARVPIIESDLEVLLLAASDDVRNYMSSHYQSSNFVYFFLKHPDYFHVDEMQYVYLQSL